MISMVSSDAAGLAAGPGNPIDAPNSGLATQIKLGLKYLMGIEIVGEVAYVSTYGKHQGALYRVPVRDLQSPVTKVADVTDPIYHLAVQRGSRAAPAAAFLAADSGKLWKVPLAGSDAGSPHVAAEGMARATGVVLDGQGNAYVCCYSGDVWRVDLGSASPHLIASGLGTCYDIALDDARANLYVTDYSEGKLWRVPVSGQEPAVVATGMTDAAGVTLRVEATVVGGATVWAYVCTGEGKLWRVAAESPVAIPVVPELNLVAYNLDIVEGVRFDTQGTAYITGWQTGVLWRIERLAPPVPGMGQPVITTPRNVSGLVPDFNGTVSTPAPAGITIQAVDEKGAVIADGITVNPVTGAFLFTRAASAGCWTAGSHTVTVTARKGEDVSAPATVTWTVQGTGQPVMTTPRQDGTSHLVPDFNGTIPLPVSPGTTIHAIDEVKRIIATNVKVNQTTGAFLFDRSLGAGPWTLGRHAVTVTARNGQDVSAPATVTWTVTP